MNNLEFEFISESISNTRDWLFEASHHVIAIYTGGHVRAKETDFDRGPLQRNLPKSGDVLVIPAGQRVGITAQGSLVEFSQLNVPTKILQNRELTPRFGYRDPLLHLLTDRVRSTIDRDDLLARLLRESLTDVVRLHLSDRYAMIRRRLITHRTLDPATQVKLVELIADTPDSEISLTALARYAEMSNGLFHRAFTASFHTTPYQYVLNRRIERAKSMLSAGVVSITDISVAVGFSSPSHFSTAFKNRVGVTPTAYRNAL